MGDNATRSTSGDGRGLAEGIGMIFDGGQSDIGSPTATSLVGTEMPAFILIDFVRVDVSSSTATKGVELGRIARARTVDGGS